MTLGIVGVGAIGRRLRRSRTAASACACSATSDAWTGFPRGGAGGARPTRRRQRLRGRHLPADEGTHHLFDRERFVRMKPSAWLFALDNSC